MGLRELLGCDDSPHEPEVLDRNDELLILSAINNDEVEPLKPYVDKYGWQNLFQSLEMTIEERP